MCVTYNFLNPMNVLIFFMQVQLPTKGGHLVPYVWILGRNKGHMVEKYLSSHKLFCLLCMLLHWYLYCHRNF